MNAYEYSKYIYESAKKDLDKYIQQESADFMDEIKKECVYLYKKAIIRNVYSIIGDSDKPFPVAYVRERKLLDSVVADVDLDTGVICIRHDIDNIDYRAVGGTPIVTEQVLYWVNYGHKGKWSYEKRKFLETAQKLIESELGVEVEIVNPKPPIV